MDTPKKTLTRRPDDARKKDARDARWRWLRNCLERHKKTRCAEMRDWAYAASLYRSEDPESPGGSAGEDTWALMGLGLDDNDNDTCDRNELFAFLDQLVATICPPNPEVTIKARRTQMREAAKYRELLINEVFGLEKLAVKLWRAVGRACIFPRSFLKVTWNKKKARPQIRVVNPLHLF